MIGFRSPSGETLFALTPVAAVEGAFHCRVRVFRVQEIDGLFRQDAGQGIPVFVGQLCVDRPAGRFIFRKAR